MICQVIITKFKTEKTLFSLDKEEYFHNLKCVGTLILYIISRFVVYTIVDFVDATNTEYSAFFI